MQNVKDYAGEKVEDLKEVGKETKYKAKKGAKIMG
jgi:hypothetical protein